MIVEVATVARLVSRNGMARGVLSVALTMRYTAADPYACAFTFSEGSAQSVTWYFARDLLAEGLLSKDPLGEMDVMVWRGLSAGVVWLQLQSRDGYALFSLHRGDVQRFVRRMYVLVQRGRESEHVDMDACVAALLEPRS